MKSSVCSTAPMESQRHQHVSCTLWALTVRWRVRLEHPGSLSESRLSKAKERRGLKAEVVFWPFTHVSGFLCTLRGKGYTGKIHTKWSSSLVTDLQLEVMHQRTIINAQCWQWMSGWLDGEPPPPHPYTHTQPAHQDPLGWGWDNNVGHWHLALWLLHGNSGWWVLDLQHHFLLLSQSNWPSGD